MQGYFPIVIDVSGKRCLVVGGGKVATRKVESLLNAGADVTVLAPDISPELTRWHSTGKLRWEAACFVDQDLSAYAFVIAATDVHDVNHAVYQAVKDYGGWINIVDRPDLCNFILPSVVNRGKLLIAVTTSGASPGLARKIKRQLESEYGPEYEEYVAFLADIRQKVLLEIADQGKRREIFRVLLEERFVEAEFNQRYAMADELLNDLQ